MLDDADTDEGPKICPLAPDPTTASSTDPDIINILLDRIRMLEARQLELEHEINELQASRIVLVLRAATTVAEHGSAVCGKLVDDDAIKNSLAFGIKVLSVAVAGALLVTAGVSGFSWGADGFSFFGDESTQNERAVENAPTLDGSPGIGAPAEFDLQPN